MATIKFGMEWRVLQNQFDSYEKHSLYIKLLSVILLLTANLSNKVSLFAILVLTILWLQDAIWKTFQSRIETRLLQLEKYILEDNQESEYQFNSEFERARLTGISLIGEYVRQSIRPTVAFPHIVLILVAIIEYLS
jgi:hypothetical protein